jgi:alpha-L-fucosidase 2
METLGESVFVHGADGVLLYICGHTSESVEQPVSVLNEKLQTIPVWGSLMEQHVKDYQKLYHVVDLKLKATDQANSSAQSQISCVDLPVDQRLQRMAEGHEDLDLEVMYFNFGRYLLISCSRPGTRAANLQGIWNPSFSPSWGSKYTININIQMNYWIAEVCGLSECHEPLFDLISGIHQRGSETAKRMYGARGFVCHHNTDNTHDTCPTDRNVTASYWVMGGAWLALHLWERYQFSRDKEFLGQYYEILFDATLFFVDFLVEDDKGRLVTCPSVSPENAYRLPSGEIGTICAGPTMDNAIIRELTQACIAAAAVLGKEVPIEFENILKKLPALEIGKHGQLMEWADDLDEVEQGHRHISHLFALHPGSQIDPLETPEFSEAAAVTLQRRLASGGGHTGWSRAWIALFFCRLHDAESAHKNFKSLLSHSTLPNMLDDHPPFQIDGNFGGASAVTEMLIQSQHGRIELLPALPSAWATGSVSGLRVRGGASVDMQWRDGQLNRVCIRASVAGRFVLCHGERLENLDLQAGEQCVIDWRISGEADVDDAVVINAR